MTEQQEVPDLGEVRRLGIEVRQAEDRLREAVRQAHEAGSRPTDLARAADISRATVYRWLNDTSAPARVDVVEVLDDVLHRLAQAVDAYTGAEILKGVKARDMRAKVSRYRLGLSNLAPGERSEELHAALVLAGRVVELAEHIHRESGKWPTHVTLR